MSPLHRSLEHLDDLAAAWHTIDGGHGYSTPQLFVLVLEADHHAVPHVINLHDEHMVDGPDPEMLGNLVDTLAMVVDQSAPGGSIAIMKARPGRQTSLTPADRRWVVGLHRALQEAPFSSRPLFFATDAGVRIVAPDELVRAVPV